MKTKQQLVNEGFEAEYDCFRKGGDFYYPCEYSKCENFLLISDGDVSQELTFSIYGTNLSDGLSYDHHYCGLTCLAHAWQSDDEIHGFYKY